MRFKNQIVKCLPIFLCFPVFTNVMAQHQDVCDELDFSVPFSFSSIPVLEEKDGMRLFGPCHTAGIAEYLEGFGNYEVDEKINKLLSGVDNKSRETIYIALKRIKNYKYRENLFSIKMPDHLMPYSQADVDSYMNQILKTKFIYDHYICSEAFFFHHGLRFCRKEIKDYIKNKDIVDCGAWCGDSMLVLQQYTSKRIYSFEFSTLNADNYMHTALKNRIPRKNFELIRKAVSSYVGFIDVPEQVQGVGAAIGNLKNSEKMYKVPVTTIDNEVDMYKMNIGFIKADIEGEGFELVKGAIASIQRFRPVLSFAIYHNADEFFCIKPFLEDNLDNYVFSFEFETEKNIANLFELVCFAYPKEIIN